MGEEKEKPVFGALGGERLLSKHSKDREEKGTMYDRHLAWLWATGGGKERGKLLRSKS